MAGEVDEANGYVLDLKLLSAVVTRQVIRDVDHRNLNTDVPWLKGRIPTSENLARHSGSGSSPSSRRAAPVGPGLGDGQELGGSR